jgi:hypothetical protein
MNTQTRIRSLLKPKHKSSYHVHEPQQFYYVGFEVFTAVTMMNAILWDIKPSSYLTGDTLRLQYRVQPVNVI